MMRRTATSTLATTQRTQRRLKSVFADVKLGPADPILGLATAFAADKDPTKVNLGVGVYRGDDNKPFILECVKKAELQIIAQNKDMEYTAITGIPSFVARTQELAFGPELLKKKVFASSQALSGTGALRVGSYFMARHYANHNILVPVPTWGNHANIYRDAGLKVGQYAYYDAQRNGLKFSALLDDLNKAEKGTMVNFHACAHNPTGIDPTQEQWREIVALVKARGLFPFVDMAYQGFASGDLDRDAFAARLFAQECENMVLCQSFAKNFGLYGQRIGAVHFMVASEEEKERVLSQVKILIRPMYSNPPIHGARIVDEILSSPQLTAEWKAELKGMADRMNNIRTRLVELLKEVGSKRDWSHLNHQIGMMAFTGLSKEQVARLRAEHHIYMTDDGRAAISGLNSRNVEKVARAFHEVTK